MEVAHGLLTARRRLWNVLVRWEQALDRLYALPAASRITAGLLTPIRDALQALEVEVQAITVRWQFDVMHDVERGSHECML